VTNQKLEELMELLDGKIKWDNAWMFAIAGISLSPFLTKIHSSPLQLN
jgi:hypothetical protein